MIDPRQMYVELPRDCVDIRFDLHYFGRLLVDLINTRLVQAKLSTLDLKSLKLMSDRLSLDDSSDSLPKYKDIKQLLLDLEKMQDLYLNRAGVEELSTYTGTRTIRIPVSGSIPFTDRVAELIHHPLFFRLNNVQQLGFTHYVFPGANHTRLEHSVGTFSNVSNYMSSMLSDDNLPYFRQLVTKEMMVSALLGGLLHDIGQNSFSHSLEDFGIVKKHTVLAEAFITGEGLEELFGVNKDVEALKKVINHSWPEVNVERLCWLITGNPKSNQPIGFGWEIVRDILSGPIDADKTDYLLRDAHHAGVEYPRSIDITRFMNSLTASLAKEGPHIKGVLAVTWKGQQSAENILLARSQMFWVLYWHHAIRCAHAMLAYACALHLETLNPDEILNFNRILYWCTMGEFISYLKLSKSKRASDLAQWLSVRRLFKRAIELNYEEDPVLYDKLLKKKDQCSQEGDKLLLALSEQVSKLMNEHLPRKRPQIHLSKDDIIIDIPQADKDKIGPLYVVEKGADFAIRYNSRMLAGSIDDWQNRFRTIRIFVDPKLDQRSRKKIAPEGIKILQQIV